MSGQIVKIIEKRIHKEKVQYLVKRAGISDLFIWEPIENLDGYPDIIEKFEVEYYHLHRNNVAIE